MSRHADPVVARETIALFAGNPNAGKTTLFNLLTGARAKVGNYPGITVDKRSAKLALGDGRTVTAIDLPGTYSLTARSKEELVAVEAILAEGVHTPSCLIIVLDATTLSRGLYFGTQLLAAGVPAVVALTMMDEAKRAGINVDTDALSKALGVPVVPLVATRGEGREQLIAAISAATQSTEPPSELTPTLSDDLAKRIETVEEALVAGKLGSRDDTAAQRRLRVRALWAILSIGDDELTDIPDSLRTAVLKAREQDAPSTTVDAQLVAARYALVDRILGECLTTETGSNKNTPPKPRLASRIDDVLVHPLWGLLAFALVMFVVFQALFAWSAPMVELVESGFTWLQGLIKDVLPAGPFTDLVVDGAIGGAGAVVVFVPQIAILFIFITILEDSGYLARVAFVIDRVMAKVGLNGKAFVPMLSGFACAIPAVMATRTIESRRDRLLTMLVVPLSSCSARLPVYALMTAVVFDPQDKIGFFATGAVALFAMYVLSVVAAMTAAFVLGRTVLKGPRPTLVLELPPYRVPRALSVAQATYQRVKRFVIDAGSVILALSVVLWVLLHYPKDEAAEARFDAQREEIKAAAPEEGVSEEDAEKARTEALAAIDEEAAGVSLRHSAAGRMGHFIEPAIAPLGFDWKIGVGLVGAFAAREVFVATLGLVYDIDKADDDANAPRLQDKLRDAKHPNGERVFTPLSGVALMVFFLLSAQCMSTLAVVRRESGSWKWAGIMFGYMTTLAYVATLLVYQVGRALHLGVG